MGHTAVRVNPGVTRTSETNAESDTGHSWAATLVPMGTSVLSLRIDGELLDRLRHHAAKRGMSVQDYVVRTLMRDDFDERFRSAVEETERFYGV
ncbi:hypothetical protein QFZ75_003440 [Streptomyces sp. V3I8]|nr:hypothetical protein [Streptomyces sp. V3I8]